MGLGSMDFDDPSSDFACKFEMRNFLPIATRKKYLTNDRHSNPFVSESDTDGDTILNSLDHWPNAVFLM